MRRLKLWLLVAAALALVMTTAAVATHKKGKTHTDSVTATLAATQTAIKNRTWTGQDGAYRQFHGRWTGTAVGDARLTGTLNLRASGLINTTTDNGQITGSLNIRGEKNGAKARFWAMYRAGQLNGFVVGWVHDKTGSTLEEQSGGGRLLGTLTGSLATTGAFAGQIGQVATPANIQGGRHHRSKHR
jgi:hypothetical protein